MNKLVARSDTRKIEPLRRAPRDHTQLAGLITAIDSKDRAEQLDRRT